MILHSVIPPEIVLDWQKKPMEKTVEFKIGEMIIEAFEVEGSKYKIQRIISSSPSDYLNSTIRPDFEFEIKF